MVKKENYFIFFFEESLFKAKEDLWRKSEKVEKKIFKIQKKKVVTETQRTLIVSHVWRPMEDSLDEGLQKIEILFRIEKYKFC